MKCEEVQKMLCLYTELSPGELNSVDAHIRTCTTCQAARETLSRDLKIINGAFPRKQLDHPEIFTNRVMAAITNQRNEKLRPAGYWSVFGLFRTAMAAMSLVLVSLFVHEVGKEFITGSSASVPSGSPSLVLHSSAFLKQARDRSKTDASFLSCVRRCREQPDAIVCEHCLERIKNIAL